MNHILPGLLAALLVMTACAGPGGAVDQTPAPSPDRTDDGGGGGSGSDGAIDHPTGADEAILVVDSVGGFVPLDFMMSRLPSLVLLGDGRVIVEGMQTLEFPGPALPPLLERRLTAEGIQAVLAAVEETNLFVSDLELRGAMNVVADAADTVFTLNAADRQVTVSIYGLGMLMPGMEVPPGMPSGEVQAHEILGVLNDRLLALETWLPADAWADTGWQPHEPEAFRLYVRDVTDEPADGGDVPEQVRDWPTSDDPAAFGDEQAIFGDGTRCGVVEGDLAATWREALGLATQMTRWTDAGERRFSVTPRPLLPHEEADCPEFIGA